MINPVASEAIFSATYVDNYIDSVENLPDDVQRHLSRIRDIDVQYRSHLRDVDYYYEQWKSFSATSENSSNRRTRAMAKMQQSLISAQELGDEKMQIVNQLQELIDQKTRQLDSDQKNLDYGKEEHLMHDLPQKISRTASPISLQSQITTTIKNEGQFVSAIISSGAGISGGQGSGNNTPTSSQQASDRSMTNHGVNMGNMGNSSDSRSNKRSRRPRNENNNSGSTMDLGGNESNSANEGGGTSGHKSIGTGQSSSTSASGSQKKSSGQGVGGGGIGGGGGGAGGNNSSNSKKKKRKARGQGGSQSNARDNREETPPPDPIDPDEPTYCLCDQISFGEMILCDNDLCPIEWFHFSCVSLVSKPKGKWYCPNCRGDRPNVMKPKAQFLKELERYNKEKEEKT